MCGAKITRVMKPPSFKTTSNHLLLCVSLSLLWLTTDSTLTPPSTKTAPPDAQGFKAVTQSETRVTLEWTKVDNIDHYILKFNDREETVTALGGQNPVRHTISGLTSATTYTFTLLTVFNNISSTGVNLTVSTVPPKLFSVSVAEHSPTSVTLTWSNVNENWGYLLHINGITISVPPAANLQLHSVKLSLEPGTEYPFSVITTFSTLSSAAYEDFLVTKIDCTTVNWHVTNSSIQGMVKGLFSKATASNEVTHVSPRGSNVSFTGLTPGATYEVSLVYERRHRRFKQCEHSLTILPADVDAICKYANGGYSISVVWDKLEGVWTEVEVNATGKTYKVNGGEQIEISGVQPAKTYEVSIGSLILGSGTVRRSTPYVFLCYTDPRGVIAGPVLGVLLFVVLVGLAAFMLPKKTPDLIRKKIFTRGSKQVDQMREPISFANNHVHQPSVDDRRGSSNQNEDLTSVGTEQTHKAATQPENKAKNRFSDVVLYNCHGVKLSISNLNETSDDINASYMPGNNGEKESIATQGPLPLTVGDFWMMIWEKGVKGIVMVTDCDEEGRTKCERYWPPDSNPCSHGNLLITMKSEQQKPKWTLREFSVKHTSTNEERTVNTAWPDHGLLPATDILIQFIALVRCPTESEGDGAPTVVHCSAGDGRTGIVIALDVLLQQLDKKGAVSINDFVNKMRLSRPHMVRTESQCIFLHQCIMDRLKQEESVYENPDSMYTNCIEMEEIHQQRTNA